VSDYVKLLVRITHICYHPYYHLYRLRMRKISWYPSLHRYTQCEAQTSWAITQ